MRISYAMIMTLAMLPVAGPTSAQHANAIHVEGAWARASAGVGRAGAVYFTMVNGGKADDRLLGAETDAARSARLHTHIRDGNIMRMRAVGVLEIPAGGRLVLRPDGKHLMLMGLKRELKPGDSFKVKLRLENAGSLEFTVSVQKMGAMGPGG